MIIKELEQTFNGYEIYHCYNEGNPKQNWYEVPKLDCQHQIWSVSNAQRYIEDELGWGLGQ